MWNLKVVLICISLKARNVKYLFHRHFGVFLWKILFLDLDPIFKWIFSDFYSLELFIYFRYYFSPKCGIAKIFSYSSYCILSFASQIFFSSMKSYLLTVDPSVWANDVLFRMTSPLPISSRLFTTFFSIRFRISCFMLRSLIHFD